MANNEDVNQANSGAPAADIPDLKKKEKDRKKAGAGWGGAKPGGGSFSGATGGAGAGARAAASAANSLGGGAAAGAAQAAGTGWLSAMIANLTATILGKAILAAGVAMFLAGAGVLGYAMFGGGGGAGGAGGIGDLGALSSSMKIRGDGGDRTSYIASNGEIMFDPLKAAEAKKAAEKAPEEKTAEEPVPPAIPEIPAGGDGSNFNRPGLEHNMSGSKLSSSLGGGFGGKNIFAGSSAAPKFDGGLAKSKIKGGEKGRLSASRASKSGRSVSGNKSKGFKSNKAFGQLKVAKGMSAMGAGSSGAEGARQTAAGAFDGVNSGAGNVVGGPAAPTGAVDSPSGTGGGAPDVTAPSVDDPCVDPNGGPSRCVGADPNTFAALNGIAAMAKKAGEMKKKAEELMIMGLLLIIAGAAMLGMWPIGTIIGAILIGIGGMLIGMSMMMSEMADMMKGMADSMSQGLAARTSDVKQKEINRYCIDKAYNEGTDPKNCNPPAVVPITEANNDSEDGNESALDRDHSRRVDGAGRVRQVE